MTPSSPQGKRKDCLLSDDDIGLLCLHFREVYVLWDGAFSLARKIDPTDEDTETYQRFVLAALQGSLTLQCSITPKVHAMLRHVKWQMKNLPGGLGDKMEDWVERLHQWGIRLRRRFWTVQDPLVSAHAQEKASSCCNHPDVLAQVDAMDAGNKRKLSEKRIVYYQPDEKNSAMRGGSNHWIISSTARRRDLPGRRYYFTMGRSICTEGKAMRRNICVILRRGSERECEVCLSEFFVAIRVT
jgi:hypothetical protein